MPYSIESLTFGALMYTILHLSNCVLGKLLSMPDLSLTMLILMVLSRVNMGRTHGILLAFGLLLTIAPAMAITGRQVSGDATKSEFIGFSVWANMGSGEDVHIQCANDVSGTPILWETIQAGTKAAFDLNVLDPTRQHQKYSCVFIPLSYSGQVDQRLILQVVWAIGSYSPSMPQLCAVCNWMVSESGLSIRDNSKPQANFLLIAKWWP